MMKLLISSTLFACLSLAKALPSHDTTVTVTEQRTLTVCPMTQLNFCQDDSYFKPITDMSIATRVPNAPESTATSSISRQWNDWSNSTSDGPAESRVPFGRPSLFNATDTSTNGSSMSLQPSLANDCPAAAPFPSHDFSPCNAPGDRKSWCHAKSVNDDADKEYRTGKIRRYEFRITNTTLNFDGTDVQSFAINGQSPGPLIEADWGDEVQVVVTNLLENNATTMHWHGIRQLGTNDHDGVPGISECGIAPGQSFTYVWHASTYGTGWYHSHLLSQFGGGIQGPIVIHGPATADYDVDMGPVMISDTFEATIFQMAWRTSHTGQVKTINYLLNGKNVSPDLTRGERQKWILRPGKKHLFRLINSSAQNAYAIHFDNHKIKVIAADFTPIVPYETDWLYISNGQRYDVIIEADQLPSSYFLRAVTQTGCPSICENNGLQLANGILEYEGQCHSFPETHLGNATAADFTDCKAEPLHKLKPWFAKTAGTESEYREHVRTLPPSSAAATVLGSSGRIIRWFLNGSTMNVTYDQPTLKTLATSPDTFQSPAISNAIVLNTSNSESWVYFVLQNQFRASHPIHLHGHDFSILGSGKGIFDDSMTSQLEFENPIRRDTALLYGTADAPSGWTVIGFQTDNPGAWVMHCHLIWHVEGGMALQFIERPNDIHAEKYWNKPEFQNQCSTLQDYQAQGSFREKSEYESGLKMRDLSDFDPMCA